MRKRKIGEVPVRPRRYALVWLFTLPWDILAYLAVLLIWLVFGQKLHWLGGLWCELKETSWPVRTWYAGYGGTTLGHGGFYGPGASAGHGWDTYVEVHEHIHVEQYEVAMFLTFMLGIATFITTSLFQMSWTASSFLSLGIWMSGYLLFFCGGWLVAYLRGERAYYGSQHEEAAYALAAEYEREKGGF